MTTLMLTRPAAVAPDAAEIARLAVLDRYELLEDFPAPPELNRLARLAAMVCGTPASVVNIVTADAQRQVAAHGVEPGVCSRQDSMCAVVFTAGRPTSLADARTDPRHADNPWVTGVLGSIRMYASAPLVTSDGVALGSLCVFDFEARALTEEQVLALETIAQQVVDVLELQLRTREFKAATDELTHRNQALGEFAGRVAHDLRSPLAAIQGFAELAQDDIAAAIGDVVVGGHVRRIQGAAGRMDVLLTDLLEFARVGGHPLVSEVSIHDVVDEVRDDLAAVIAESGAQVVVRGATLRADCSQLRALLQNTVGNAIAHRDRTRPCQVAVACDRIGTGWCLQVIDGPGIPEKDRARVLQPFQRANAQVAGTGLGLATAARIAAAHGGRLDLHETPGGGLTVTITAAPPAGA